MADDVQILLEYVDLLEAELKGSSPEKFKQLIQKRDDLLPLLQQQRTLISTLHTAHRDDQTRIVALEAEIASLRSEWKALQAELQDRPNAGRKS